LLVGFVLGAVDLGVEGVLSKCPDELEFGPLPKTSTGMVQKFALREREWGERKTRVGAT
jgi:acyl-CoA synthetase (AMP-forming)/AMP-acid ligase II